MKKRIQIKSGFNFHNQGPINIIIDDDNIIPPDGNHDRDLVEITSGQARKIDRHFCGMSDCLCGSSPVIEIDYKRYAVTMP